MIGMNDERERERERERETKGTPFCRHDDDVVLDTLNISLFRRCIKHNVYRL